MSTTRGANKSLPRIFKDRPEGTGHLRNEVLSQPVKPYLRLTRFQGDRAVKKKR